MYQPIIETITSPDDALRHRSEHELLAGKDKEELLRIAEGLEFFRKHVDNLYHRVRACLSLRRAAPRRMFSTSPIHACGGTQSRGRSNS